MFNVWAADFDKRMGNEGRNVVMIIDNASSHMLHDKEVFELFGLKCAKLDHTMFLFLPPNITSHAQRLDQGIISLLKREYQSWLLLWYIEQFNADQEQDLAKVGGVFQLQKFCYVEL